jgi:hypothetical protein
MDFTISPIGISTSQRNDVKILRNKVYMAKGYSWVETKAEILWTIVYIMPFIGAHTKKWSLVSSYKDFCDEKCVCFSRKKPPHWSSFVWDAPIQRDQDLILFVESISIMGWWSFLKLGIKNKSHEVKFMGAKDRWRRGKGCCLEKRWNQISSPRIITVTHM